jgi:tetratricopeptide (TPR) repeat protein
VRAVAILIGRLVKSGQGARAELLWRWVNAPGPRAAAADDPLAAAALHEARAFKSKLDGDLHETLESFQAAVESCRRAGDRRGELTGRVNVGDTCLQLGAYARAEEAHRHLLDDCRRLGLRALSIIGQANLGAALARQGRADEALAILDAAVREAGTTGDRYFEFCARVYRAEALAAASRSADVADEARRALQLAFSAPLQALARAVLARALLQEGRIDEAVAEVGPAHQTVLEAGSLDEGEALVRLVFAEAQLASGPAGQAAGLDALRKARRRLLERASMISDAATRQGFLSAVAENARTLELASRLLG